MAIILQEMFGIEELLGSSFSSFKTADLWGAQRLYGRENHKGQPIFLKKGYLRPLVGAQDDLNVLDFVSEAFEDMYTYVSRANSFFKKTRVDIRPRKAHIDLDVQYDMYIKSLYNAFFNAYNSIDIGSFDEFVRVFIEFLSKARFVFTKTAFLNSPYCDPAVSGIMLEVSLPDHNDDAERIEMLAGKDALFRRKTLAKFGFMHDLRAPWRFVADLHSPVMREYMKKKNVSSIGGFFDKYYTTTGESEFEVFAFYLEQFYESYITSFPEHRKFFLMCDGSEAKIKQVIVFKEQLKTRKLWAMLEYYTKIRFFEQGVKKTPRAVLGSALYKAVKEEQLEQAVKLIEYNSKED